MSSLHELLPKVPNEERTALASLTNSLTDQQLRTFAAAYENDRKEPSTMFWITFFLGTFGVHQFMMGKTGKGVLYLFTLALLSIGWWIDIFSNTSNVREYNLKVARGILAGIR